MLKMQNPFPPREKHDRKRGFFRFFLRIFNTDKAVWRNPVKLFAGCANNKVGLVFFLFSGAVLAWTGDVRAEYHLECNVSTFQPVIPVIQLGTHVPDGHQFFPFTRVEVKYSCRAFITPDGLLPIVYNNSYVQYLKADPYIVRQGEDSTGGLPTFGLPGSGHSVRNFPGLAAGVQVNRANAPNSFNNVYGDGRHYGVPNAMKDMMYFWDIQYGRKTRDSGFLDFTVIVYVAFRKAGNGPLPSYFPPLDIEILKSEYAVTAKFCRENKSRGCILGTTVEKTQYPQAGVRFRVNFQSVSATCPTPTVSGGNTRTLASVRWDELPSVGSVAKHQDLNLQFNNCSNHLSKIRYRIGANGTSSNPGQGLLPLIAPSTASGLAVQVLERRQSDNTWVVSPLGDWRERTTSGGSHTLPMGIRYYRTGNLVGGNVRAAMTISFQYQ